MTRFKTGQSATEELMKEYKVPMTRENYLRLNSHDGELYTPTAEEEADIPVRFRLPEPEPKVIQNPENKMPEKPARAKPPDWDALITNLKK